MKTLNNMGDRWQGYNQKKREEAKQALETKRSMLDRFTDVLNVGQYVSAGIAKGIVDKESTVIGNVASGIKAGNPFGQGHQEGEHSYSDVLEEAGWKPESTLGKVAKGTVGFLGDVFLDPTTYLTLGLGTALKGGKGALEAVGVADKVMDATKATDVVRNFAQKTGAQWTEEVITKEADNLLKKYNSLIGVNQKARNIEASLSHAPFGEKLFGEFAKPAKTLVDAEKVAAFGDKTIAPYWQKLRSDIMKSKFADLFSNNARLYKKALENPDDLYKYMRSEVMQKATTKEVLQAKDSAKKFKKLIDDMDLSPDEQKVVREMMEDPSTFNIIYARSIVDDMEELNAFKSKLDTINNDFVEVISSYIDEARGIEDSLFTDVAKQDSLLKVISDGDEEFVKLREEFSRTKEELKELKKTRKEQSVKKLTTVQPSVLEQTGKLDDVNDVISKEILALEAKIQYEKGKAIVDFDDEVITKFSRVTNDNKADFVNRINEIYDLKISPLAPDGKLNELKELIVKGHSRGALFKYNEDNIKWLSGYNSKLYTQIIAPQLGYKNWKKDVETPLKNLVEKINSGVELTSKEKKKLNYLQKKSYDRLHMVEFYNKNFPDLESLEKHLDVVKNMEMEGAYKRTYEEFMDEYFQKRREGFNDVPELNPYKVGQNYAPQKQGKLGEAGFEGRRIDRYEAILDADEKDLAVIEILQEKFPQQQGVYTESQIKIARDIEGELSNVLKRNADFKKEMNGYRKVRIPYLDELDPTYRSKLYKQSESSLKTKFNQVRDEAQQKLVAEQTRKAAQNARKFATQEKLVDDIAEIKDITDSITAKIDNPAEISKSYEEALSGFDDLAEKIRLKTNEVARYRYRINKLSDMKGSMNSEVSELAQKTARLEELERLKGVERDAFVSKNLPEVEELMATIHNLEVTIDDKRKMLDSFNISPDNWENIEYFYNIDKLAPNAKVKAVVEKLREEFMSMGLKEVEIGRMKQGQFDKWAYNYLPHILTDEGAEFIRKNQDQINKSLPGFSASKIGYGRKFNPHSKARSITEIVLNDEVITNPNIDQLNKYFAENFPELKNNKVFLDNISDLYIQRAMKHVDVVYDHKYMREMMEAFGTPFELVMKETPGEKIVVNYGTLREEVSKWTSQIFSETWDDHLSDGVYKAYVDLYGENSKAFRDALEFHKKEYMNEISSKLLKDNYGLDPRVLDDLATPMIELTYDQAMNITDKLGGNIYSVNDLIVDKANMSRKYQIKKDNNELLNMYDKFTHFIKLNQTTVMPAFHIRNKISNTFNNWLAIGSDAVNPRFQKSAWEAMSKKGDIPDMLTVTKKDGSKIEMAWRDIYEKARQYGVLDEGFFEKDLGTTASTAPKLGGLPDEANPLNTKKFKLYEAGAKVGSRVEGMDRLIHFASQISRGMDFDDAYESVNKYLFDYSDLTGFEKETMKRIFPYYTWLRKNAPLQLESMLEYPEKYRNVSKVMAGISNSNNQEDRMEDKYTSDFAQDWVQTPLSSKEGNPIIFNPNLPVQDLNRIPDPSNPRGTIGDVISQMNPLLKVSLEQATNHNFFFDNKIVKSDDNELMSRIDHILSQFSMYNTGKNIGMNEGTDRAMQALNALAGLKFSEYEYKKNKGIQKQGGYKK